MTSPAKRQDRVEMLVGSTSNVLCNRRGDTKIHPKIYPCSLFHCAKDAYVKRFWPETKLNFEWKFVELDQICIPVLVLK